MLKKLRSLFIVEENQPKKETASKTKAKETKKSNETVKPSENKTVNTGYAVSGDSDVDEKIVEKLLSAIEKNNQSGFDYIEYKKALQSLEKMPMDEATRYQSAFATASTIGATLPKLVKSAKYYVGIIDKENTNFLSSFDKQYKAKIDKRKQEIVSFENIIKNRTEELKKINKEIEKFKHKIEETRSSLSASEEMMHHTQENFKIAYYNLRSQMEGDIQKMEKYLK